MLGPAGTAVWSGLPAVGTISLPGAALCAALEVLGFHKSLRMAQMLVIALVHIEALNFGVQHVHQSGMQLDLQHVLVSRCRRKTLETDGLCGHGTLSRIHRRARHHRARRPRPPFPIQHLPASAPAPPTPLNEMQTQPNFNGSLTCPPKRSASKCRRRARGRGSQGEAARVSDCASLVFTLGQKSGDIREGDFRLQSRRQLLDLHNVFRNLVVA